MAENHRALLREWNLPRWSAGYWGERTAGALAALPADLAAAAAAAAVRGGMLYDSQPRPPSLPDETPAGSVAALGRDSGMPLGSTEDATARLLAALRSRWSLGTSGPRAWLESELVRAGYAPLLSFIDDHSTAATAPVAGTVGVQGGATNNVAWPSHTAGDIGLLWVASFSGVATPSGWTAVAGATATNGSVNVYYRIAASGAEAAAAVGGAGIYSRALIVRYRGPTIVESSGATATSVSGATVTMPSLGVVRSGRHVATGWVSANNAATWSTYSGDPAQSELSDTTGTGNTLAVASGATGRLAAVAASAVASVNAARSGALVVLRGRVAPDSHDFWARFWVDFPEGAHQALGSAAVVGSAVVGTDSIGPFTQPDWLLWFRTLVATVERTRPAQWVCWDYRFVIPDGTIRIMGHYRFQDTDYAYFTAA